MDEKTMVNDILNQMKLELLNYENIITKTENLNLRQVLIQIRNNEESLQYELYKIAKVKNYYKQSDFATACDIQSARKENIQNFKSKKVKNGTKKDNKISKNS